MPKNVSIKEIHQHRETLARKCDFEAVKLIAHYRQRDADRSNASHPLVILEGIGSCVVREKPSKP